jgi:hypothetical protein
MSSLKEKRKRIQFVYKTTNLLNGTYYIGVHSTWNIDDGYLGSGKRLGRSIKKHGKENFKREILAFFETNKEAYNYESHLVNEELIKDELCLNLKPGGSGGFPLEFITGEKHKEISIKGGKSGGNIVKIKFDTDEEFRKNLSDKRSNSMKNQHIRGDFRNVWKGRKHTEQTIEQMKNSHKGKGLGETNSQFGTCWITNGIQNMKIHKGDTIPEGWYLGRK